MCHRHSKTDLCPPLIYLYISIYSLDCSVPAFARIFLGDIEKRHIIFISLLDILAICLKNKIMLLLAKQLI